MTKRIWIALSLIWTLNVHAQAQPAEVLLFGVFHFANPGRDVVRVDRVDVSTPENQAYLEALAERLCAFKPTIVLLEFDRAHESEARSQLAAYVADRLEFGSNEIHQIGFRVAETCGVEELYGFDESEVGELLIRANDSEKDRRNKDLYLLTNAAGAGSGVEGAGATARWWHRNIRMYANIQRYAVAGERVLVVAGQGRTAILRDFLDIDRRISAHDIHRYL